MLKSFQIWPVGAPAGCFLFPFDTSSSFLGALLYFLTENILGSFCIFSALALNQLFLQRALAQEGEKWYLKTKIWVLNMFIATGVSYLVDPLSRQREGICIYIFLCMLKTMNSN